MEGIILLGLAGIGYLINNDNKEDNKHRIETNVRPDVFQNSNSSIYDLNNVADAQEYEQQLVKDNFKKTLDPQSNVVSHFDVKNTEITGLDGILNLNKNFDLS